MQFLLNKLKSPVGYIAIIALANFLLLILSTFIFRTNFYRSDENTSRITSSVDSVFIEVDPILFKNTINLNELCSDKSEIAELGVIFETDSAQYSEWYSNYINLGKKDENLVDFKLSNDSLKLEQAQFKLGGFDSETHNDEKDEIFRYVSEECVLYVNDAIKYVEN